jgi:hypothetical protein
MHRELRRHHQGRLRTTCWPGPARERPSRSRSPLLGSLIGTASGVSVPMLHRYLLPDGRHAPHPGGHAWLMSAGGYVVGVAGAGLSSLVV